MTIIGWVGMIFCAIGLAACSKNKQADLLAEEVSPSSIPVTAVAPGEAPKTKSQPRSSEGTYKTIEWTDLIPKEDLDELLNPPEYLNSIEDGSEADAIDGQLKIKPAAAKDIRYEQALVSTTIVPEYNNKAIRLPGFIVPLEFNDAQTITTFFLVPFFGACIHVPPPPPNQIIYAEFEPGIKLDYLYDPFWVEGTLITTLTENDLGTAAYSMTVDHIDVYNDD